MKTILAALLAVAFLATSPTFASGADKADDKGDMKKDDKKKDDKKKDEKKEGAKSGGGGW